MAPNGHLISCKRRDCAGFSQQWERDQRTRLKWNLAAWKGFAQMVTFTAPGRDVLPFDTASCGHPADGSMCSGPLGCTVLEIQADQWNRTMHRKWARALRRARLAAKRKGVPVESIRVLAYATEVERGVCHLHVALGWTGAVSPGNSRKFKAQLKREMRREGYGRAKDSRLSYGDATGLGSYLGKYLGKGGSEALKVVPARVQPVYVSPVLTRDTGVTMRFLRLARRFWRETGKAMPYAELVRLVRIADAMNCDLFTGQPKPLPRRVRPKPEPLPLLVAIPSPPPRLFHMSIAA